MSKENVQRFLEKVASTPELAKKLRELDESHIRRLIVLAGEAGIPLTRDDFPPANQADSQPISDEEVDAVTGGDSGGRDYFPGLGDLPYAYVKKYWPQYVDRYFPK